MTYMALSLAFTASGLLLCYLLWNTNPVEGQTLNAVLLGQIAGHSGWGNIFVVISLIAEGLLLVVAAQAGFIDGPRVLANMAVDSWVPRRFACTFGAIDHSKWDFVDGSNLAHCTAFIQEEVRHSSWSCIASMFF
jgi:hypothetical protein